MVGKLIGFLMHSRNQTHIFHLQTSSFAKHKALQDYYEGIIPLVDDLSESYQGRYGKIRSIEIPKSVSNLTDDTVVGTYLMAVLNYIENNRQYLPQDADLQATYDDIIALLTKTLYLIKELN